MPGSRSDSVVASLYRSQPQGPEFEPGFRTFGILTVVGCQAPNLFQRIGVEGGGLALCPVGCGALVVPAVPGGSDLILPAGAWLNTEVRSAFSFKINDKKQR